MVSNQCFAASSSRNESLEGDLMDDEVITGERPCL
jgi:hypothetical protein